MADKNPNKQKKKKKTADKSTTQATVLNEAISAKKTKNTYQ